MTGPGVNRIPVAGVAGGYFAQRRQHSEGEAEFVRVEAAAYDLLRDWLEPGELSEFPAHLPFGLGKLLRIGMDGAEDEDADGAAQEFLAMGGEEATGVFVQASHVQRAPEDDGAVAIESRNFAERLSVDGQALLEEIIRDSMGDVFGGSVAGNPGDENSGRHQGPPGWRWNAHRATAE